MESVIEAQKRSKGASNKVGGQQDRLLSLDAFRGLTILAMILVNNPGSRSEQYWPLAHAEWHGWTPTDLIFPFFLFILGTSLAYSLRKYRGGGATNRSVASPEQGGDCRISSAVYWRIVRRGAVLLFLGLFLNFFDDLCHHLSDNEPRLTFATVRFSGVLQRIALVYLVVSLVALHVGVRSQVLLAVVLLLGYWALLAWLPRAHNYEANLSSEGNVVRVVDREILGETHMFTKARIEKTDPQGLLSTLPATVNALLGYWAGLLIQRHGSRPRTAGILVGCGVLCVALGLVWNEAFPINKKLWTSSFMLLTGGLAMIVLGGCLLKFDVWGWRRMARPFEVAGINAIFLYVGAKLIARLLANSHVGELTTKEWLYQTLGTSWINDPKLASLVYAGAMVAFWWLLLWGMWRRGWAIRV